MDRSCCNCYASVGFALLFTIALGGHAATFTPLSINEDPLIWGTSPNEAAFNCAISGTGLVLGFESHAANLVVGDRNGRSDVFVGTGGTLQRVSQRSSGTDGRRNAVRIGLSSTGRYVVFLSGDDLLETGSGVEQPTTLFLRDLVAGTLIRPATTLSGEAATVTDDARVTANGRYVLFVSATANLVAGDTNNSADVFRFDTTTGAMVRVSTNAGGGQMSNSVSGAAAMDGSGDLVAFAASDGDLIAGDNNGFVDVFIKRISTGAVVRASQTPAGVAGNGNSRNLDISNNGAFVAFETAATNLISGDTNNVVDVVRYELGSGQLVRASVGSAGQESSSASNFSGISAAGRYVFFDTVGLNIGGAGTVTQLFGRDFNTDTTTRFTSNALGVQVRSRVNDAGDMACIMTRDALDPTDGNWATDVYRLDLLTGAATRISLANAVVPVIFGSGRTDSVDVARDATRVVAVSRAVDLDAGSFDELGNVVRSTGAESQLPEFVPATGDIRLLARAGGNGALPQPSGVSSASLSADGSSIAFISAATNLDARATGTNVYRQVPPGGAPTLISLGTDNLGAGGCNTPVIDASGARVAFQCSASNLVVGDTNGLADIFVWDSATGLRRVSVSSSGVQATGTSSAPDISDSGQWIAFVSTAANLVAGDTNNVSDVFVHDRNSGSTERVSLDAAGVQRPSASSQPAISPDGRFIAYLYAGSGNDRGLQVYDRIAALSYTIALPSGVSATLPLPRFGREARYLSFLGSDATGTIAYRFDLVASSLRELLRTSTNIYAVDNVAHGISSVRVASATQAVIATDQPLGEFDRNNDFDLVLVTLNPGVLSLASTAISVDEGAGTLLVPVQRSGGTEGAVGAFASVVPISASGNDFTTPGTAVSFADNQSTPVSFEFGIVDDVLVEGNETLTLQLVQPNGGATIAPPSLVTITIVDNDQPDAIFANGFQ